MHVDPALYESPDARNIELYSRLGYTIDGEEELPHGTVVYMSKPLMEIRSR